MPKAEVKMYGGAPTFASMQWLSASIEPDGILPNDYLYQDRVIARDVTQFQVELSPASSALYYTGALEKLRRGLGVAD